MGEVSVRSLTRQQSCVLPVTFSSSDLNIWKNLIPLGACFPWELRGESLRVCLRWKTFIAPLRTVTVLGGPRLWEHPWGARGRRRPSWPVCFDGLLQATRHICVSLVWASWVSPITVHLPSPRVPVLSNREWQSSENLLWASLTALFWGMDAVAWNQGFHESCEEIAAPEM